jgi:urease accessory protein
MMVGRCIHAGVHNGPSSSAGVGGLGRNRISAAAEIVAVAGGSGVTRLAVLSSQVPLVLRRTPDAVYVVGGAAGPIGGDQLALRISVGAGAFLRVRTAAASIALPGPDGLESVLQVTIDVQAGARVEYLPEPVVASTGARHATIIRAAVAEGASLLLRDELLLGRHGEAGGAARSVLHVNYAGRALLRQSLEVSGANAADAGPALLAGHRGAGTVLHVDPALGSRLPAAIGATDVGAARSTAAALEGRPAVAAVARQPPVAVMPLAGPGMLVTALANDAVTLRHRLSIYSGLGPGPAEQRLPGNRRCRWRSRRRSRPMHTVLRLCLILHGWSGGLARDREDFYPGEG